MSGGSWMEKLGTRTDLKGEWLCLTVNGSSLGTLSIRDPKNKVLHSEKVGNSVERAARVLYERVTKA